METINPGEAEIINRILAGETALFEIIIDAYGSKVAGLIANLTGADEVEDIVQEVFVSVYRNLGSFQHRSRLGTWIYRITINKCRDWQRSSGSRRTVPLLPSLRASPSGPEIEDVEAVRAAVRILPEKYRTIIILYYYQDLNCQEIAELLEMPKKTVETRLARGRALIKKRLHWGGEAGCTRMTEI